MTPSPANTNQSIDLLTAAAIRHQCQRVFERIRAGEGFFSYDPARLPATAGYVVQVIREQYPDLQIPYHSRWRHVDAGGTPRLAELDQALQPLGEMGRGCGHYDHIIVSVLLDAGAGSAWRYPDRDGQTYQRSEGLAVAACRMFTDGFFSGDPDHPLQAGAAALRRLDTGRLGQGFCTAPDNPMTGLNGRTGLLHRLGDAVDQRPDLFPGESARPGNLFHYFVDAAGQARSISAVFMLETVLQAFGPVWPARDQSIPVAGGRGDIWYYAPLGTGEDDPGAWVPFHKLSQWLTYSLIEPLEQAGINVSDINGLTGLAEYRNGGLLLDSELIQLKAPRTTDPLPGDEVIVEWRALTVCLLDALAPLVREGLGFAAGDESGFPLARMLEGGTWAAGRRLAKEKRKDGTPPISIRSDGTVF